MASGAEHLLCDVFIASDAADIGGIDLIKTSRKPRSNLLPALGPHALLRGYIRSLSATPAHDLPGANHAPIEFGDNRVATRTGGEWRLVETSILRE
jgi:hypothetical protein